MFLIGQKIPLVLKLTDSDATKFVRARIYDDAGAQVPESPIELTHKAQGLYTNDIVYGMPDKPFIVAVYTVFNDALFTIKDPTRPELSETFLFDLLGDRLIELVRRPDLSLEVKDDTEAEIEVKDDSGVTLEIDDC